MLNEKQYTGKYKTKNTAPRLSRVDYFIEDYKRTSSGHFFDENTMRFFKSRVPWFFAGDGKTAYFITSERFDYNSPRLYTVRKIIRTADRQSFYGYKYNIDSVSEFQAFKTIATAKRHIERLLKGNI